MENFISLLFGLIATLLMSGLLYLTARSGVERSEWVRGVGSSIPTGTGGSLVPGASIHLVAGAVFGFVYLMIGQAFVWVSPAGLLAFGAGLGVARGLAVSAMLALVAFDQQPGAHMARAGFGVGACHVAGNIVYGLTLSLLFGASRIEAALAF